MTPQEREQFELEIYLETKKHRGCIEDAADFLRHPDSSRISKIINSNDPRANGIGMVLDVLEGFNHKHPELEEFIWEKMCLKRNGYKKRGKTGKLAELASIADRASREQLDVPLSISLGKSIEEIQREAFQAHEHSKIQLEKAMALNETVQINEVQ